MWKCFCYHFSYKVPCPPEFIVIVCIIIIFCKHSITASSEHKSWPNYFNSQHHRHLFMGSDGNRLGFHSFVDNVVETTDNCLSLSQWLIGVQKSLTYSKLLNCRSKIPFHSSARQLTDWETVAKNLLYILQLHWRLIHLI